ncbi:hypothetical protein EJ04DRAFT_525438 [Polyplosphaeria fusca]|uniref:Uncharacterized protein n=1 Tax=Polyplosphaeria fusca TaxID=682080 RepID=A0A9P4V1H3_9PLEO|nr:hypothetical protein EJ04DRAFT_525438 [Polyplosphaeria fusca]
MNLLSTLFTSDLCLLKTTSTHTISTSNAATTTSAASILNPNASSSKFPNVSDTPPNHSFSRSHFRSNTGLTLAEAIDAIDAISSSTAAVFHNQGCRLRCDYIHQSYLCASSASRRASHDSDPTVGP